MKRIACVGMAAAGCLAISALPSLSATVTIDPSKQYQTIEGFGAFGGYNDQVAAYVDQTESAFLHDDAGFTVLRLGIPYANFQSDSSGSFSVSAAATDIAVINGMKRFPDVRFIASLWTPPAWMKDMSRDAVSSCGSGTNLCGGHLRTDMQSALGKYLVGFYNVILQQTGVRLYGISLQNEADFPEPYISCVYTTSEYRDALKAVGRRFADAGISVKLFGAEDMLTALPSRAYIGTINADAQAKPYLGAVAVHGYVDGVNPIPSSGAAQAWARLGQVSKAMGIGAWMTESSGFATDWGGAMQLAMSLYTALRYGNLSLWTFWADGATSGCNEYSLLCDGDHTTRSLVSKNFYRYIRPGAVRIGSAVSDSTCFVVAFNRSADSTLTLVVYNENSGYQLNLAGANLPSQLSKYVTTSSKACVAEGTVGSSGIAIEASSVTTLVGRNYRPALSAVGQPSGVSGQRSGQRIPSTSVYTLNGALLCRAGDLRGGLPATAGVRVRVSGRAAAPALVWGPGR